MADLLSHPWMTGDAASHDEFCKNYDDIMQATLDRVEQENFDAEFNIDEAEKQSNKRGNGQRSSGDKFPKDFEETHTFNPVPTFDKGARKTLLEVKGDESHPLAIMHYLYDLVSAIGENPTISNSRWKLTFDGIMR